MTLGSNSPFFSIEILNRHAKVVWGDNTVAQIKGDGDNVIEYGLPNREPFGAIFFDAEAESRQEKYGAILFTYIPPGRDDPGDVEEHELPERFSNYWQALTALAKAQHDRHIYDVVASLGEAMAEEELAKAEKLLENRELPDFPYGEFDNGYHWKGENYPYE